MSDPGTVEDRLVGTHVDTVSFAVEYGKIAEFVKACDVGDKVHSDHTSATQRGLKSVAATPTHVVVAGHQRDSRAMLTELGIDYTRVVVGGSSWTYQRPAVAGDSLTGRRRVTEDIVRENKQGHPLRILEFETEYTDSDGAVVVVQRETIIERPYAS